MPDYGQTNSTLWGPNLVTRTKSSPDGLEISLHTLPKQLQREFHHVFSEHNLPESADPTAEFLALPTNQRAYQDLVKMGEQVELEKDRLLNVFMDFARELCNSIRKAGYWADYIDPCSGLPMMTLNGSHKVYSEVDGMECCLNYKSYNAGFCKVLAHPRWGTAVYPATMFACAPRHFIVQLLEDYPIIPDACHSINDSVHET